MDKPAFRASGVGKCSPELLHGLRFPDSETPIKENDRALFLMAGHALQAATSWYFSMHGHAPVEEEKTVHFTAPNFTLSGHIDMVMDQDVVNEVKWIMHKNFIKLLKEPSLWTKMYAHYADQLACYVWMNNAIEGTMTICNRNDGNMISPYSFPSDKHMTAVELTMPKDEADDLMDEIIFKLDRVVVAFQEDEHLGCDKGSWCFFCNPPIKKAEMGGKMRHGDMTDTDRKSLLQQAKEAIKGSG